MAGLPLRADAQCNGEECKRAGAALASRSTHLLFANVTPLAGQPRVIANFLLGGKKWLCAGVAETHIHGEGQFSLRKFVASRGCQAYVGDIELSERQHPLGGVALFVRDGVYSVMPRIRAEGWDHYVSARALPREVRISPACTVLRQLAPLCQGPVILTGDWQNTPDQLALADSWMHAATLQV